MWGHDGRRGGGRRRRQRRRRERGLRGGRGGGGGRVEALTREIQGLAQEKRLGEARELWAQLAREGLEPSAFTHAAILNAHVNSGDLEGGEAAFTRMRAAGHAANVVCYTTLLKGYCNAGAIGCARALLDDMVDPGQGPRVVPDARCCNTFLRGCLNVGALRAALEVREKMRRWDVCPTPASQRYVARLLAQGLRLPELKALVEGLGRPQGAAAEDWRAPCQFWGRGRCDRGDNCRFYHDPRIKQQDAAQRELEALDTEALCCFHWAHAAALVGDREQAAGALERARRALRLAEARSAHAGSPARLFSEMNRGEVAQELDRLGTFLEVPPKGGDGASGPSKKKGLLAEALGQVFVFSSQLAGSSSSAPSEEQDCPDALTRALEDTFGLDRACSLGLASRSAVRKRIRKCFDTGGRLRWHRVFRSEERTVTAGGTLRKGLPVKLEICSGNGDWVVAQADQERGEACWGALELRHDRVYNIFSRLACSGVRNLANLGGDAFQVLRRHVPNESVAYFCINFPEPPHHSGQGSSESHFHLLTGDFFREMHRALEPGGGVTIFSDNQPYLKTLAREVGGLTKKAGEQLFVSVEVLASEAADEGCSAPGRAEKKRTRPAEAPAAQQTQGESKKARKRREKRERERAFIQAHPERYSSLAPGDNVSGVRVYRGVPGRAAGHAVHVASYFDRFWEHGRKTERFYIVLSRH